MRWWLRAGVALLVVVLGAEVGARALVERTDNPALRWHDHTTALKVGQIEQLDAVDVLVLGTSMAQQGLVPEVMSGVDGVGTTYNAALNGGVPVVMEPWLIDQLLPTVSPELVVWGLGPLDVSDVYGDEVLAAYRSALETRPGALATLDRGASAPSLLMRERTVLRSLDDLFGVAADRRLVAWQDAAADLGPDGERVDFRQAVDEVRAREIRGRITPMELDRDDLAALIRTTQQLQADGVMVVFVRMPLPDRFTELFADPSDPLRVDAALERLAEELDVELLESDEVFAESDFVDFTHLDAAAAARFSADIGRQLADLHE